MAYFPTKDSPLKEKWVRVRGVAGRVGLSSKAKEKHEKILKTLLKKRYKHVGGDNSNVR